MPDDGHNEHSPLLAPPPSSCNSAASTTEQRRNKWSPKAISYLFLMVIVAVVTAESISLPALTRIYESIYCRQYYAKHDPSLIGRDGVPEKYCKVSRVQGDVAMLKAWQTFFDATGSSSSTSMCSLQHADSLAGLSLAVPWGYYADTRGRKPILLLVSISLLARSIWIQVVCESPWWLGFGSRFKQPWQATSGKLSLSGQFGWPGCTLLVAELPSSLLWLMSLLLMSCLKRRGKPCPAISRVGTS